MCDSDTIRTRVQEQNKEGLLKTTVDSKFLICFRACFMVLEPVR